MANDEPLHDWIDLRQMPFGFANDGIESDFLEFNAGTEAVIAPSDRKGVLVA